MVCYVPHDSMEGWRACGQRPGLTTYNRPRLARAVGRCSHWVSKTVIEMADLVEVRRPQDYEEAALLTVAHGTCF